MRVLMIHGRSQGGKVAAELKATWVATLEEGFKAAGSNVTTPFEVDFPYYADKLDAFAAAAQLPSPTDLLAKGPGQNRQFEEFMQSAVAEMRTRADISDTEVEQQVEPGQVIEKGAQNWPWVQAIVRAIDSRLGHTSSFTIEKFLRDVFVYTTNREVARQINAIVEAEIRDEPTIVIGHSLGSVVAYNVLMKNKAKLKLRKFITVGSPLGIKAISSKLGVAENPAASVGWFNAYDERDIVALNPLTAPFFGADPAVENYDRVKNSTDNRHGIVGYLNDVEVAKQIAAAL